MAVHGGIDVSLKWTLGLLNSANRYLTAETFQCKVTANGTTMKQKQIWTLLRHGSGIALQSHAGKFLSIDKDGNVNAAGEEIGPDQTFTLETQDDGRVAIKSSYNRYLGGSGDSISGFFQTIDATNLFTIHLAMHPQINLFNVCRRTFCRLKDESELVCDEEIPWGSDALIILEFHGGKYALRASNGMVLHRNGDLVAKVNDHTLFTIVFRDTHVAFKDREGKYLTAVGAMAKVQSRKGTIGKDELFVLMDSHPQLSLTAVANGKLVSIRDGLEVRANQAQETLSDSEIFQMEAVDRTDKSGNCKWALRGNKKKYWSANPGITDDADSIGDKSQFVVEWLGPMIALKSATTGKYISVKTNGKMSAESAELTNDCKFVFDFINRPLLVLRGSYGFVGVKGGSGVLECNRSQYDIFHVECKNGVFHIKGSNGKYMSVDGDGNVTITSESPVDFIFELRVHTHVVIIAPNGKFLQGAQNGSFTAKGSAISSTTLWEY